MTALTLRFCPFEAFQNPFVGSTIEIAATEEELPQRIEAIYRIRKRLVVKWPNKASTINGTCLAWRELRYVWKPRARKSRRSRQVSSNRTRQQ